MTMPKPEDFFNSKTIGGKRYTVTALGAIKAWQGWTLILKTMAPILGEVIDSKNIDADVAMFEKQNTFKEILSIVASNLHDPEMDALVFQMLEGACCEGELITDLDTHFAGKVHLMMELIIYATEVNFKGFFTESDIFPSLMQGLGKVMTVTDVE